MSARTHYLNARRTLRKLLDWRIVPVINENDTTTTDEISFGDNDFLAAQVAVLVGAELLVLLTDTERPLHGRPARRPGRDARGGGRRPRGARRAARSGTRRRRSARAGCARRSSRPRWPPRPGSATVIASGLAPGVAGARRWAGERGGHALPAPGGAPLELQAVAEVRQAVARDRDRRRGRGAGAARGRHALLPVGHRRRRGRVRRRRRGRGPRGGAAAIGKGICNYSAAELRQRDGHEVRRRCARCCRARPRRPSTGTTSCSPRPVRCHGRRHPVRHRHLPRREAPPRASSRGSTPRTKDRALLRDRRRARGARAGEILEANARDLEAGPRVRALRRADGPARARRGAGRRDRRAACATIVALPDPVGEVIDGSPARRTGSTCARCACRSASSPSSTRRGRTSRSTPPRCA